MSSQFSCDLSGGAVERVSLTLTSVYERRKLILKMKFSLAYIHFRPVEWPNRKAGWVGDKTTSQVVSIRRQKRHRKSHALKGRLNTSRLWFITFTGTSPIRQDIGTRPSQVNHTQSCSE